MPAVISSRVAALTAALESWTPSLICRADCSGGSQTIIQAVIRIVARDRPISGASAPSSSTKVFRQLDLPDPAGFGCEVMAACLYLMPSWCAGGVCALSQGRKQVACVFVFDGSQVGVGECVVVA